eukprot:6131-Heterococcus_DN1.PRE.4
MQELAAAEAACCSTIIARGAHPGAPTSFETGAMTTTHCSAATLIPVLLESSEQATESCSARASKRDSIDQRCTALYAFVYVDRVS